MIYCKELRAWIKKELPIKTVVKKIIRKLNKNTNKYYESIQDMEKLSKEKCQIIQERNEIKERDVTLRG